MPTLETPEFTLALDEVWIEVESGLADRYLFESALHDASLTISVEPVWTAADALDEVARNLADHRVQSHLTAAQDHGWLFEMVDPVIIARDWGRMVAYHGRLKAGGAFSFVGLVLATGVISLFAESDIATPQLLDQLLSEVAAGMEL